MPYTAFCWLTGETRIFRDIADLNFFFTRRCPRGWSIL